jgi:hypothetical protein
MAAYNLIATTTVGSGGASTINFTSIPQTYTDLLVVHSGRTTRPTYTRDDLYISFNGVTTNLTSYFLYGTGAAAGSTTASNPIEVGWIPTNVATASIFGNASIYIPNYTGSTYKSVSSDCVMEDNATSSFQTLSAGLWSSTAAITSLTLSCSTNSFVQYSSASLYGIKNS